MAESSESLGGWSNGSKRKTQLLQKGTFDTIEKNYWQNSTLQTTLVPRSGKFVAHFLS